MIARQMCHLLSFMVAVLGHLTLLFCCQYLTTRRQNKFHLIL